MNLVLSIIGTHGGGSPGSILARKIGDIGRAGLTFWAYRSHLCRPDDVHLLAKGGGPWCWFLGPSSGGAARPTTEDVMAVGYSSDRKEWEKLPEGIGPVTGCVRSGCCALVLDVLEPYDAEVDLWEWRQAGDHVSPVRFMLGGSTVCVEGPCPVQPGMKSRFRRVVARGRLVEPWAVWLR